MLGKQHILISLFFILPFAPSSIFIVFFLIGSIFPDIDSDNSYVLQGNVKLFKSKFLGFISHLIKYFFYYPYALILSLIFRKKLLKHRGVMHSIFPAILFSLLLSLINHVFGIAFLLGYLFHLFEDGLTKSGVCLFNPFKFLCMYGKIKTGEGFYNLILNILCCFMLVIPIFLFYKLLFLARIVSFLMFLVFNIVFLKNIKIRI